MFCPKCGAPAEGRFCAKCGAPLPASETPPNPPPGPTAPGLGLEQNLAAALCYIPIIGLVFLLIEPYNRNRTIRFHAWQAVLYAIGWFIIMAVLGILGVTVHAILPFGVWALWALLMRLVHLALLIGLIFAAVKAYQGQRLVLPIIGPIAERQA